ncbi:MAG: DinB family protein [Anaerolineales bacterium]|nr:DinB family protein [Anaerolineales bacterium]
MKYRIGVENGFEGKTLIWVLDHPGCFTTAEDADSAIEKTHEAILQYAAWVAQHERKPWVDSTNIRLVIEETWQTYRINEKYALVPKGKSGYEVNAWFLDDWKPLTRQEIQRGYKLLNWSRQDFLELIQDLPPHILDFQSPGERWSIRGIIRHVGIAEWWYLDRLNLAFPYESLPSDVFDIIRKSRESLLTVLPGLENKPLVIGMDGEFWSPRKLLRRAIWHERDHTNHINTLLKEVQLR